MCVSRWLIVPYVTSVCFFFPTALPWLLKERTWPQAEYVDSP